MSHTTRKHGQRKKQACVIKPCEMETKEVPYEFCKYIDSISCRFTEICNLYLKGLSLDDIKYLKPEDLICLVPPQNYEHKLLMTILARRYLYRNDDGYLCLPCTSDSESCDIDSDLCHDPCYHHSESRRNGKKKHKNRRKSKKE